MRTVYFRLTIAWTILLNKILPPLHLHVQSQILCTPFSAHFDSRLRPCIFKCFKLIISLPYCLALYVISLFHQYKFIKLVSTDVINTPILMRINTSNRCALWCAYLFAVRISQLGVRICNKLSNRLNTERILQSTNCDHKTRGLFDEEFLSYISSQSKLGMLLN